MPGIVTTIADAVLPRCWGLAGQDACWGEAAQGRESDQKLAVEDNDIGFNNNAGFGVNYNAGGSKVLRSTNLTYRRNYVHDNAGPGLWCDGDDRTVLFEDNRLERNVGAGISFEISSDAVIRRNTFRGNGPLPWASRSGTAAI